MKYLSICFFICISCLCKAQPVPECANSTKRLFIKSDIKLVFLKQNNTHSYIDSSRIECFKIWDNQIIKGSKIYFFEFKVYQANVDYQQKDEKQMHFVVMGTKKGYRNNNLNDGKFSFYIEIKEFIEGTYYIDISKKRTTKAVNCYMCRGEDIALDITPNK